MSFEPTLLGQILEGALLAAGQPQTVDKLLSLFDNAEDTAADKPSRDELKAALQKLQQDSEGRGFELVEVASGWRFQVRQEIAPWVNRLWDEKPQKYSRALLETLALIAYRQPITRGDIEEIRGVAVSSHIIRTLVEREWVKVVGHRDVPGRPSLFATTKQFLDYFNLKSLEQLPSLNELQDIEALNKALELNLGGEPERPVEAKEAEDPPVEEDESTTRNDHVEPAADTENDSDATAEEGITALASEPSDNSADKSADKNLEAPAISNEKADNGQTDEEPAFVEGGLSEAELQQPAVAVPLENENDDDEEALTPKVQAPSLFNDTP